MRMLKHPIVEIQWVDAETEHGWKSPEEIETMQGANCTTVGFLVRKPTKKNPIYVVAATVGYDADGSAEFNAIHKIPKAWVKSYKEIVPVA